DHAGAGRGGPDDDRLSLGQHGPGGVRARRSCRTECGYDLVMRHSHRCHGPRMRATQYPPPWESCAESYGPGLLGRPDKPGDDVLPDGSGLPGERHLVERLVAEALGGTRNRAAAERAIELDGRIVVGQRPDHQAAQAALGEIAPGRGEQPAAEAQALEFRPQVAFIALAG